LTFGIIRDNFLDQSPAVTQSWLLLRGHFLGHLPNMRQEFVSAHHLLLGLFVATAAQQFQ